MWRLIECHQAGRCLLSCRVWSRSFLPCVLRADTDQQYTPHAPTPAEGQNTSTTLQENTHFSAKIYHSDSQVFQQRWRMWTEQRGTRTHTHTPGVGQLPSGWTHSCPVDTQDSRELSCWVCGTPAALGSSGETTGTNWTSTAALWFSPERRREVQLLPEAIAPVHNTVSCSCCSYPESWVWSSRCRPPVCACVSERWDRASSWLGSDSGHVVELLCRQSGTFQECFPDRVYHSKSDRSLVVSLKARLCSPIMQWGCWQLAVRLGLGMSGQSL